MLVYWLSRNKTIEPKVSTYFFSKWHTGTIFKVLKFSLCLWWWTKLSIIWQEKGWFQQENSIHESLHLEEYTRGLYFPLKLKNKQLFSFLVNSDSGGESSSCGGSVNIITSINLQRPQNWARNWELKEWKEQSFSSKISLYMHIFHEF